MKDFADVYLAPEEVAQRLGVSLEEVHALLRSGRLRGVPFDGAWQVPERAVASFTRGQNISELLFEEYASEHLSGSLEHEPPFAGTRKLVDYRLTHEGQALWFEVKEFDDDEKVFDGLRDNVGFFDPYVRIRMKIGKAVEKFRDYDGECCSLVLFNERYNLVDICTPRTVLGAMLGDVGFSIPINLRTGEEVGPMTNVFTTGGKLIHPHIKEPRNTTISAVIALARFPLGQREFQIIVKQKEIAERRILPWQETLDLLQGDPTALSRRVLRTIIYENPYGVRPLPRDIFAGPFDERWGPVQGTDHIGQVYVGLELEKLNKRERDLESEYAALKQRCAEADAHGKSGLV